MRHVCALVLVCSVVTGCPQPRTDTRGSISGQVILQELGGIDDMTRVRVDLGRGEGGITPAADGTFTLSDLEPDAYDLSIVYTGGLGVDSSGSAYKPWLVKIPLRAGSDVSLGAVELSLGSGKVHGTVALAGEEGTRGTLVRLSGSQGVREVQTDDGTFAMDGVPVGRYQLSVTRENFGSACGEVVTVGFDGEDVPVRALSLARAEPVLTPAPAEVADVDGARWFLRGAQVSLTVSAPFARDMRSWVGETPATLPAYADVPGTLSLDGIPLGETTATFQFRDACGLESVTTRHLIHDRTPPVTTVILNGGLGSSRSASMSLLVTATDDYSLPLMMKVAQCTGTGGAATCTPSLAEVDWMPFQAQQTVTWPDAQGVKSVQVKLRDRSLNETAMLPTTPAAVTYDNVVPQDVQVVIGDGSGTIHESNPLVSIVATGASTMKVGTEMGLVKEPWLAYRTPVRVDFTPDDGEKHLYVRLADEAGNETDELHFTAALKTTGSLSGTVAFEESGNATSVEVKIPGSSFVATPNNTGAWSLAEVPAGAYVLDVRVTDADAAKFEPEQLPVAVAVDDNTDVGTVQLRLARGGLSGNVTLEGRTSHEGVLVEVVGTTGSAATNGSGAWGLTGLKAGPCTLRVSREGYASTELQATVVANVVTAVPAQQLSQLRGAVTGKVLRENAADHGDTRVSLVGTSFDVTTNAEGLFTIPGVPAGFYDVLAEAAGFDNARLLGVNVAPPGDRDVGILTLERLRGALAGKVTLEGRTSHDGTVVEVVGGGAFALTSASGDWSLDGILSGPVTLRFSREGYVSKELTSSVVANTTTPMAEQNLLLPRGTVTGVTLRGGMTDHRLVHVSLGGPLSADTDINGAWTINNVPAGFYDLVATSSGFEPATIYGLNVRPPEVRNVGTINLEPLRGRIMGTVALEGQLQHGGARVVVTGSVYETLTDASGSFAIAVSPGTYNAGLTASKPGFRSATFTDNIVVLENQTFNVGQLGLDQTDNEVSGFVEVSEKSVYSGVEVRLDGENLTPTEGRQYAAMTEDDGSFHLPQVMIGQYRIRYVYTLVAGYETYSRAGLLIPQGPPQILTPVRLRARYVRVKEPDPRLPDMTRVRDVTLAIGASDCVKMQVSNSLSEMPGDLGDPSWVTCQDDYSWQLSEGEGPKTVYARFTTAGAENTPTDVVSDEIFLDSITGISAFSHTANADYGYTVGVNDQVHFSLMSGETGGRATVAITGYADNILMYDDGTHGDVQPNDGTYELDYRVTLVKDVTRASVTGYFTDRFGNGAQLDGPPITIVFPPLIRNIRLSTNSNAVPATVTVAWETDEPTTSRILWGLDASYGSQEESPTPLATSHAVTFAPGVPGVEYHYQVVAEDAAGNPASTNDRVFRLIPNRPTQVAAVGGIGRVHVRWELLGKNSLKGFNVYRGTASGGPYTRLTATPYMHEALVYEDRGVADNTTYYYVVRSVDLYDNESDDSDEVGATPGPYIGPTEVGPYTAFGAAVVGVKTWSERGSPYRLKGSISVEEGGLLAIGPKVEVIVEYPEERRTDLGVTLYRFIVHGRIAVIGEVGAMPPAELCHSEGVVDGMVSFRSEKAQPGDNWDGIHIEATTPDSSLDFDRGQYLGGNLFYRARLAHAAAWTISASVTKNYAFTPGMAVMRSVLEESANGIDARNTWVSSLSSFLLLSACFKDMGTGFFIDSPKARVADVAVHRVAYGARLGIGWTPGPCDAASCYALFERMEFLDGGGLNVDQTGHVRSSTFRGMTSWGLTCGGGSVADSLFEDNAGHTAYCNVSSSTLRGAHGNFQGGQWAAVESNAYGTDFIDNGWSEEMQAECSCQNCGCGNPCDYCGELAAGGTGDLAGGVEVYGCRFDATPTATNRLRLAERVRLQGAWSNWRFPDVWQWNAFHSNTFVGGDLARPLIVVPNGVPVITHNNMDYLPSAGRYVLQDLNPYNYGCDANGCPELIASENHWEASVRAEMLSPEPAKNISAIYDYYDNVEKQTVDYSNPAPTMYPRARIATPWWRQYFREGATITFTGSGVDPEEGVLAASQLQWRDNSGNLLGTGSQLEKSDLPVGVHRLWLHVFDSNNQEGVVPVEVEVWPQE